MKKTKKRPRHPFLTVVLVVLVGLYAYLYPDLILQKFAIICPFLEIQEIPVVQELGQYEILKKFDFTDDNSIKDWQNKAFKGLTRYWIDRKIRDISLHSKSNKTASALYYMITYNSKEYPLLSWKWHPVKFPNKKNSINLKDKDDYAIRVYVVFSKGFFTNFRCIEYAWDEFLPKGTKQASPFSDKIMQIILETGTPKEEWVVEERNIYEDYKTLFGQEPEFKVKAVAIMTDSEGTKDSSEGYVKEMKIYRTISSKNKPKKKVKYNWTFRKKQKSDGG